jgi:prostamide/prostaglandin F2alpha synthase
MGIFGSASERQHTHPPERADAFAEIELPDQDEVLHRLGDYWSESPAVLVWLRHYG